jgi:hypothetical protein
MLTILKRLRHYVIRARVAAANAPTDDYLRGYLQGVRHRQRVKQFGAQDEHAQWVGFADTPESMELERGYRDGLAGVELQR